MPKQGLVQVTQVYAGYTCMGWAGPSESSSPKLPGQRHGGGHVQLLIAFAVRRADEAVVAISLGCLFKRHF